MLRLLLAGVLGAGTTLLVVSQGTFVYSAFQVQLPFRSALKVTPDPANIWSWHGRIVGSPPFRYPIIVDMDGNGRSDTENPHLRVLITDVQYANPGTSGSSVWLSDGTTRRWFLGGPPAEHHFETPIMLPVGSMLTIEFESGSQADVNVIGRIVTL